MKEILNDILKNKKYDLSQIILNNELTIEEYLEMLKIIWNNQIPEVRIINNLDLYELLDNKEKKENTFIIEDYKKSLNDLYKDLHSENDKTKEFLIKIYKRAIKTAKHGISFEDSIQQAFDGYTELQLLIKQDIIKIGTDEEYEFYLNSFCDKYILDYVREEFLEEKSKHLYSMMVNQVAKLLIEGHDLDEIADKLGVHNSQVKEIYEIMHENNVEINDELMYNEEQLKEEVFKYQHLFNTKNLVNRFSLEEENFLIMYLSFNGSKSDLKKQIMNTLFLSDKEYDILLNKVIFGIYTNLSMYTSLEYGHISNNKI